MDTKTISALLLIGRIFTFGFIIVVFRKQLVLLRSKEYPELNKPRKTLLFLSVIAIAGNMIPIIIDIYGIFGKGSFGLLLAYVFSNNITALVSAVAIFILYRISEKITIKER